MPLHLTKQKMDSNLDIDHKDVHDQDMRVYAYPKSNVGSHVPTTRSVCTNYKCGRKQRVPTALLIHAPNLELS